MGPLPLLFLHKAGGLGVSEGREVERWGTGNNERWRDERVEEMGVLEAEEVEGWGDAGQGLPGADLVGLFRRRSLPPSGYLSLGSFGIMRALDQPTSKGALLGSVISAPGAETPSAVAERG